MTEASDPRFLPFSQGPPADISTSNSDYEIVQPTGGVAGARVEFNVSASSAGMIDLSRSYIRSRLKIDTDAGGNPVVAYAGAAVSLEEGFSDAMWSDMDTFINGVSVGDSAPGLYPHSAFYRNALTRDAGWAEGKVIRYAAVDNNSALNGQPQVAHMHVYYEGFRAGWGAEHCGYAFSDSQLAIGDPAAGGMFSPDAHATLEYTGRGFTQLKIAGANSRPEFITLPAHGIWKQKDFLPSNVDLRVTMTKSANTFCLHAAGGQAPQIDWANSTVELYLRRVYPTESMREVMASAIIERPLRYNLMQSRATQVRIANGAVGLDATSLLAGVRPDTVLCTFVRTASLGAGAVNHSPFATINVLPDGAPGAHLTSLFVNWGGKQYPMRPYSEAGPRDSARAYADYLAVCEGGAFGESHPMITPVDHANGHRVYAFNLRGDGRPAGEAATDLSQRGSLEVHAQFNGALPAAATLVVIGFNGAAVEIDAARSIRKIGF